ncbi:ABC transporter substrate-binding protein [Actinacidiphila oryziradicis]|uniref:ABC transporter substrate-binding protein n=1 Tax=Actinacidiphila oryziradicis TaxID=2571141 RepID=UPI0023F250ED|nr:ABC transporter substrate-binding protein [Actinacidiphila oryziradicis]MCW2872403.1 extracellular solute-binding protein family 5 [Actinacidiphila oryziradicis]
MRKTVALVGAGILTLGIAGCGGGGTSTGAGNKTLTLGMSVVALPWDLSKIGIGYEATYDQPVYDTLVRLDSQGKATPNLATSWTYDSAQTTLSLKLRTGVKFTDGTAVDAAAVKASLLRLKGGSNTAATELADVKSVEAVDTSTVALKLDRPSSSLLPALGQSSGMIASPKALNNPTTPVGSGPYKLDASGTTAGTQYTYTRNADYWNSKAFPYNKIVIKYLSDSTARTNALLSGQINGTLVDASRMSTVKARGMNVITYQPGDIEGLYIWDRGGTKVPALGKLKVRQALNYAIDRQAIIKKAKLGLGGATTQLFGTSDEGYDKSLDSKYPYDPAKAKKLLAEAGYPNGFSVTLPDFSALFPKEQAAIDQSLADIGVKVKLDNLPNDQIFTSLLAGKYAMSYFKLGAPSAWDKVSIEMLKNSTWNPFKYDDPKVDSLVSQIKSASVSKQPALLKQLNTYIVDQAWNAPLNLIANAYASSSDVKVTPQPSFGYPPIYNFKPAH